MTNNNRSSYIRVEDQNQTALNELFSVVNNPTQYRTQLLSKPFRDRGLPESFFQPPSSSPNNTLSKSTATSSSSINNEQQQNVQRQHAKNQLSLPNIPSQSTTLLRTIINNNHIQGHLRTVSDTAVLDGQGTTMASTNTTLSQINSQVSLLPLPDGWEEKQTPDGQAYYIDHMTQCTTWMDPRPSHYAAFQSFCATLPLPDGYEQSRDARGNTYFIDHNNKQTCWDDPRPNYYRSMMTKRLDVPIPPTPMSIPQSSTSPIPTSSSPFHQQRLSSSTLSPTTSMAQLTTNSPPIVSQQQDPLKNKLSEILNEQRALQQRKEELERMEADIRKMLNHRINTNNSSADQATIDSLIDDLLHHKRQNSEDSGVGEGRNSINRTPDALSSTDYVDDPLFLNQADYAAIPVDMELPVQDPQPMAVLDDTQLKIKSIKQNHQWLYHANT
ncbi:unnamed protein product [Rotaria sp. Silwood1]|nr:unnamed protein product [Rotaria sp. Silwood1]CAF3344222.1 unnamed protein product [Rotaria sp. Silwood1]CAF4495706.1 unnamed protein product [Rotaria sp. Silwood1]